MKALGTNSVWVFPASKSALADRQLDLLHDFSSGGIGRHILALHRLLQCRQHLFDVGVLTNDEYLKAKGLIEQYTGSIDHVVYELVDELSPPEDIYELLSIIDFHGQGIE